MDATQSYLAARADSTASADITQQTRTAMAALATAAQAADGLALLAEGAQSDAASLDEAGQLQASVQLANRISQECWAAYEACRTALEALARLADAELRLAPPAPVTNSPPVLGAPADAP